MNTLRLIIDKSKFLTKGYNCAVDVDVSSLPFSITEAIQQLVPNGYRDGLTYDRADFIMCNLLRILSGYNVKATITDHTQRKTQVCPF